MVFLHAFITSGQPGGRAGEGRRAKLFLDTSSGERAGGQAAKVISGRVFSKIIAGHVFGRAGGRTGWQSYFWTRLAISGRVVVFLHAFITRGRPGGRAGEGRMAKLFLDTSSGGRAGGQAAKVISGHVFSKNISGHVSGRAGGWADRLAKLFLDASCYFWTRCGISARVLLFRIHNERAAGRAGGRGKDGKTISGHVFGRAGGAGGQAAKVISGHVFHKFFSGHVSRRPGGRARKGGRRKILEVSSLES